MLIVANWKAYVSSRAQAKALFATAQRLIGGTLKETGSTIVLAPPAPYLGLLAVGNRSKVRFAAQDVSSAGGGAHTGEVTAALLHELGVSYALIGHSERRALGETDTAVASKVAQALAAGMTPILCIGERERDADAHYLGVLRAQLAATYASLTPEERALIIVAYEPVWAIGKTAAEAITPPDLTEMVLYLRKVLAEYLPEGQQAKILYGGSVEQGNIRALRAAGIEGFLVGRASTEPATFTALAKALS